MTTHKILAEETVSVSELRKNPSLYFTDHPIAVMSHNHAAGYIVGAELFETMMAIIEQNQKTRAVVGQFRPASTRLKQIARESAEFLLHAKDDDLVGFSE
jgi:antitoxin YafN